MGSRRRLCVAVHCRQLRSAAAMSMIMNESNFQHILRVLNTNLDGKVKVMFALTNIKGVGRRFSNICCKKAEVDLNKRAGELTQEEVERLVTIVQNPRQFKVPDWMLNRKKDVKDGKFSQVVSNTLDMKLREDLERLKKIRAHRGLRHYWGLRVRGQRTKTTGPRDAPSVSPRRRARFKSWLWHACIGRLRRGDAASPLSVHACAKPPVCFARGPPLRCSAVVWSFISIYFRL